MEYIFSFIGVVCGIFSALGIESLFRVRNKNAPMEIIYAACATALALVSICMMTQALMILFPIWGLNIGTLNVIVAGYLLYLLTFSITYMLVHKK